MNRSILIVICDFLLLSLLTFSTDINHMADENTRPPTKIVIATNVVPNPGSDLAAAMKLALEEERRSTTQLQQQLAVARESAGQQQSALEPARTGEFAPATTGRHRANEPGESQASVANQLRAVRTGAAEIHGGGNRGPKGVQPGRGACAASSTT